MDWRLTVTVGLFVVLIWLWSQFELRTAEERAVTREVHKREQVKRAGAGR